MKTNDMSFNFIRAVCALGIIVFHFSCHISDTLYRPLFVTQNFAWENCLVSTFFLLSGLLIYRNNRTVPSLGKFYIKRVKSIFPSFYLAFFYCFIVNAITSHSLFYIGSPKYLVLSVFGMDGYFSYRFPSYYILGEWFLGAIILLYLLYPIVVKGFNRLPVLILAIVTGLYIFGICFTGFKISDEHNLFTCLFCFVLGMVIEKYELYKKTVLLIPSILIFVILTFLKIPVSIVICGNVAGICLLFILYNIGKIIMKSKCISLIFNEIGRISYQIFLLQHLIIVFVLNNIPPADNIAMVCKLALTIVLIIAAAEVLNIVTKAVTDKLFTKRKPA